MSFLPFQAKTLQVNETEVVIDVNGSSMTLPRSAVAGTPNVGETLQIIAIAPGKQQDTDQEIARAMLNRLLGEGSTNA